MQDDRLKKAVIDISYQDFSEESSEQELSDLIQVIASSSLQEEISKKRQEQREAQQVGNKQLVEQLTLEIVTLAQKLQKSRGR